MNSKPRWIAVKNTSGEVIPPFAAMEPVSIDKNGTLLVIKPNKNDSNSAMLNGAAAVPKDAFGFGTYGWPMLAKYDPNEPQSANGEALGTRSGYWELFRGHQGFLVWGKKSDSLYVVQRDLNCHQGSPGFYYPGAGNWPGCCFCPANGDIGNPPDPVELNFNSPCTGPISRNLDLFYNCGRLLDSGFDPLGLHCVSNNLAIPDSFVPIVVWKYDNSEQGAGGCANCVPGQPGNAWDENFKRERWRFGCGRIRYQPIEDNPLLFFENLIWFLQGRLFYPTYTLDVNWCTQPNPWQPQNPNDSISCDPWYVQSSGVVTCATNFFGGAGSRVTSVCASCMGSWSFSVLAP